MPWPDGVQATGGAPGAARARGLEDGMTASEADFQQRCLQLLVRFSASLRWPMLAAVLAMAAVAGAAGARPLHLGVWLGTTLLVREWRAALLLRLAADNARPIAQRLRQTTLASGLLGASHGVAALLTLGAGANTEAAALLTMLSMSLSAGAVATTFSVLPAFVAYGGAIALPFALAWAAHGGWLGVGIGLLVLMFFGVQLRFARENLRMYRESYQIRLENTALMGQLDAERSLLSRARDEAVAADLSKSRFLAAASHDLRQPLQSLSLNIGALLRQPLDVDSRAIGTEIGASVEDLRQMLDGLLDVSTLDSGHVQPRFQRLALGRLVGAVCQRLRPAAQARGLHLVCDCPPGLSVISDAEMLGRILSNVVHNALKFTDQGEVRVSVQRDGNRARLSISDTGCGIAEHDLQRVFDDLEQVDNRQRSRASGFGLGLGIVRRLARLLGIDYRVRSTLGEGTHFDFYLPLSEAGSATVLAGRDGGQQAPGLVARRVLVLDDDEAVRTAYDHALQALGCRVHCAANLAEAEHQLRAEKPEVALVDHWLDDRADGLSAIAALRSIRPALPAVIVSADTSPALREAASALGVRVLRKPVSEAGLAAAIVEAMRQDEG